jgi:hypothetical protein
MSGYEIREPAEGKVDLRFTTRRTQHRHPAGRRSARRVV